MKTINMAVAERLCLYRVLGAQSASRAGDMEFILTIRKKTRMPESETAVYIQEFPRPRIDWEAMGRAPSVPVEFEDAEVRYLLKLLDPKENIGLLAVDYEEWADPLVEKLASK